MGAAGTTTVPVGATTNATFTNGNGILSGGHTFTNNGTFNETVANSYDLATTSTSSFLNYGTFTTTSAGTIIGGGSPGTFTNEPGATLTINPGAGNTTTIAAHFDNLGTVNIASGSTLQLAQTNTTSDTGTYNGPGNLTVLNTRTFATPATINVGNLTINSGTATVSFNKQKVAVLTLLGGTQSGDLTVTSSLTWTSGTMGAAGTTTVPVGATTNATFTNGNGILSGGHTFTNNGTFNETVANSYDLDTTSTSSFLNYGTFTTTSAGTIIGGGSPGTFTNEPGATLTINPGAGNTTTIAAHFDNLGTVNIASGSTLQLAQTNTTSDTGTYNGPGNLTVLNTRTFATPATINVGNLTINSGTATVSFNKQKVAVLTLLGGTQSGDLTVTSSLTWTSGTMGAAGTTTVPVGATTNATFTNGNGILSGGHTFTNNGTFNETVANTHDLLTTKTSSFLNYGTFTTTSAGTIIGGGSPGTFTNEPGATLTINPGAGNTTTIAAHFINLGTINLVSGTFVGLP